MQIHELPREQALPDKEKMGAIMRASEANDVPGLQRLINTSPASTEDFSYSLLCATKKGAVDTARYLLKLGTRYGGRFVIEAVNAGSIPMLELLREYGWQVNDDIGEYHATISALG
jgi:hypothetical protein